MAFLHGLLKFLKSHILSHLCICHALMFIQYCKWSLLEKLQSHLSRAYCLQVGFGRALRAPVFLGALPCHTGCAPPRPSQLRCSPQNKKINYFQKQNVFLQAQTQAPSGIYFFTGLSCTFLSYAAPYWASLHLSELRCILLSYAAPY